MMSNQAMNALATGQPPKRIGNANPNLGPYQVLPCADGHFIIAVGNDGQFERFCTLLGVPDLAHHPDYVANKGRVVNRAALSDSLGVETVKWTKANLLQVCEDRAVPAGPINNMIEAFDEEQARFHDVATTTDGVPTVRSPFRIDGQPVPLRSKSPDLGSGMPEWLSE